MKAVLCFLLLTAPVHAFETEASWYSVEACRYNRDPKCPTASGKSLYELERRQIGFAAMWDCPLGSQWKVCRADDPSRCTTVIIEDRGPNRRLKGRKIDLSKRSFQALGNTKAGVLRVTVEPLERMRDE